MGESLDRITITKTACGRWIYLSYVLFQGSWYFHALGKPDGPPNNRSLLARDLKAATDFMNAHELVSGEPDNLVRRLTLTDFDETFDIQAPR